MRSRASTNRLLAGVEPRVEGDAEEAWTRSSEEGDRALVRGGGSATSELEAAGTPASRGQTGANLFPIGTTRSTRTRTPCAVAWIGTWGMYARFAAGRRLFRRRGAADGSARTVRRRLETREPRSRVAERAI